jgi:flagellar motility protein MotE (MotC chaperone)
MTRHRGDTYLTGLRDRWVRAAIAVVVGLKLVGFIPVIGTLTSEAQREGSLATALAADPKQGAKPSPAHAAGATGEPESPASAGQILPGDPPRDGPSAAFAEQSKVMHGLLDAIKRRSAELDLREAELVQRETALGAAEDDLDKKIGHLESLTVRAGGGGSPAPAAAPRGGASAAAAAPVLSSMDQLGRIYGAMKAEEAAPLLDRLDDETVRAIFANMKQKQISAVLPLMKPEKAVALTRLLGGRQPVGPAASPSTAADAPMASESSKDPRDS